MPEQETEYIRLKTDYLIVSGIPDCKTGTVIPVSVIGTETARQRVEEGAAEYVSERVAKKAEEG